MKITRKLNADSISLGTITQYRSAYEVKAGKGAIYIKEYTGRRIAFDAIVTPNIEGIVKFPRQVILTAGFKDRQELYVLPYNDGHFLLDKDLDTFAVSAVEGEFPHFTYRKPVGKFYRYAGAATPKKKKANKWRLCLGPMLQKLRGDPRNVVCSIFQDGDHSWLEFRPDDGTYDKVTISYHDVSSRIQIPMCDSLSGLTFRMFSKTGDFTVPTLFRDKDMRANATYPIWVNEENNCIIVEKPIRTCSICGNEIRSTLDHCGEITVGKEAAKTLGSHGKIHGLVKAERAYEHAIDIHNNKV